MSRMKPITFACRATLSRTPTEIVEQILDVTKWPEFQGYGPIPGIQTAVMERRTPEIVGTRIRVTNRDGSSHTEEIIEWKPDQRLRMQFGEFSPPLSRLASRFFETWEFQQGGEQTNVIRSFEIEAKSWVSWPILWMISFVLKQAIARHLQQLKNYAPSTTESSRFAL
jgi:hypothetical protein